MLIATVIAAGLTSLLPPAQYDYRPDPVPILIQYPAEVMPVVCGPREGMIIYGCADAAKNQIYIREGLPPRDFDIVLRHEWAHINGWSFDHD